MILLREGKKHNIIFCNRLTMKMTEKPLPHGEDFLIKSVINPIQSSKRINLNSKCD